MLPDRVSNPGPLTYESSALPIALRGQANFHIIIITLYEKKISIFLARQCVTLNIWSLKNDSQKCMDANYPTHI